MTNTLAFELEKTLHLMKRKIQDLFRENKFPITKDQWMVLERVAQIEGSNQKDIAKDTFKDPAALTRMLDILVEKGFVQRKASEKDRRTFDIYLTVEGGRLVNKIEPVLQAMAVFIEKGISKDERNGILTTLEQLERNILAND